MICIFVLAILLVIPVFFAAVLSSPTTDDGQLDVRNNKLVFLLLPFFVLALLICALYFLINIFDVNLSLYAPNAMG